MIELAIAVMSGLAAFGLARAVRHPDRVTAARIASMVPSVERTPRRAPLTKIGALLPGDRSRVVAAMKAAGVEIAPDSVIGLQVVGAALGVLVGLMTGPAALLLAPVIGVLLYRAPLIYLKSKAASRRAEVSSALPDAVELLAVCAQAGLNITMALRRVADATPGLLGRGLRMVVDEVSLGVPRAEATRALVDRYDLEDLRSLAAALDQADRFGAPVAATLDALASDIRIRSRNQVEEAARRAPVKMLFPLVLLILPAFILLTIVPLLIGTFRTLGF